MKHEFVVITPAIAAHMLKSNCINRPIRKLHVKNLADIMARGEFHTTHQGLAFDTDGNLLDGQHRLMAIALQAPGFKIIMAVTTGMPRETFIHIDSTQLKRSVADSLHIEPKLGAVGRLLYMIMTRRSGLVTAAQAQPYCEFAREGMTTLQEYCGGDARYWSAAPVQAAVIVARKIYEDGQYPLEIYRALVHDNRNEMTPLLVSFSKAVAREFGINKSAYTAFAKCLYAFDVTRSKNSKISIKNEAIYLGMARYAMSDEMDEARLILEEEDAADKALKEADADMENATM